MLRIIIAMTAFCCFSTSLTAQRIERGAETVRTSSGQSTPNERNLTHHNYPPKNEPLIRPIKKFQLSITPDIAIHPETTMIRGLQFNIWGENEQRALTAGLINGSHGDSSGISFGLLHYTENYKGIQLAPINYASGDFHGWQGSIIFGFFAVNRVEGRLFGVQTGILNTATEMKGVQAGFINVCGHMRTGFQIGFVNYTEFADDGVQIGLINIIRNNYQYFDNWPDEIAPAMVFVNWRF